MCVNMYVSVYEGRVDQMDASDKHLSTKKLRGKMEIELCVSSTASTFYIKHTCVHR